MSVLTRYVGGTLDEFAGTFSLLTMSVCVVGLPAMAFSMLGPETELKAIERQTTYRGSVQFTAEQWETFAQSARDESYWTRQSGAAAWNSPSVAKPAELIKTASTGNISIWRSGSKRRKQPRSAFGSYRTVCVRLCDGYFWPVSFTTGRDGFRGDEKACKSSCGAETKLFYYANPGQTPDDMVDLRGRPYKKLRTAFRYTQQYTPNCKCRADPWEQASVARHRMYADLKRKGKLKRYLAKLDRKQRRNRPQRRIRYANFGAGLTANVSGLSVIDEKALKRARAAQRAAAKRHKRMALGASALQTLGVKVVKPIRLGKKNKYRRKRRSAAFRAFAASER